MLDRPDNNICDGCPLLFCDSKSESCKQTAEFKLELYRIEKEQKRHDHVMELVDQNAPIMKAVRERLVKTAEMGFRKYDNRFRYGRRYWRRERKLLKDNQYG